jgi:hypothetical protein
MEQKLSFRDRKRASEKVFTRKEVNEMLQKKQKQLDVQYSVLKEVYTKYELLKKENEELKTKLSEYEAPNDGYRKDWTWVAKIVFAIEQASKPLRSAEIIEFLEKREPHLRDHTSKQQYFSAFLAMALKAERIKREKRKGERGFYYDLNNQLV